MRVATTSEIIEQLNAIDIKRLLNKMELYVRDRFYDKSDRNKRGFQFQDFCQQTLTKACDGTRKWKPDNCSFEQFIFWALQSDLDSFFKKFKRTELTLEKTPQSEYIINLPNYIEEKSIDDSSFEKIDEKVQLQEWIKQLKDQGADKDELEMFEFFAAGIDKPKEIAELLDKPIEVIYTISRRLRRKKIKLNEKWTSLKKQ
jgi:RNA polymerase sporulation-specific sigma factor|tara:strand:- start:1347 stop:1949 length:603 start_codon:yes stop_codon:yes gene_type:complete